MIIDKILQIIGIKDFSKEEYGYLLIYLVTFVPLIYKFISPFFILAGLNDFTILINPTIFITGLIIVRNRFINCIRPCDIILYFVTGLLLYINSFIYPANALLIEKHYIDFFIFVLSFYFVGLSIDYSKNKRVFSAVARIGIWFSVYWQCLIYFRIVEVDYSFDGSTGEQMGIAYHMLFCMYVIFVDFVKNVNFTNIFYFGISILMLSFMGTRGPIIIFAIFVVVYLLFFHRFNKFKYLKKAIILVTLITFIVFLDVIMMSIVPIAESLGFSTRVFNTVLEDRMVNLSDSSGRDEMWTLLIRAIQNNNGGIGYGWLGDRLLLGDGLYSHNFELEILIHFGSIIGGIMLFLLFLLILKSYFSIRHSQSRDFWLLMLFAGLIELQLSKTYVDHPHLFVMIGYFVSIKRRSCM